MSHAVPLACHGDAMESIAGCRPEVVMECPNWRGGLSKCRIQAHSLVTILGLGVGVAACLLLLALVCYSLQYNSQLLDTKNVYVVKQRKNTEAVLRWYDQSPLLLRAVASSLPGVTNASGYVGWFPLTVKMDGQLKQLRSLTVLPGFAETLRLQPIKGDLQEALSRSDTLAITEGVAIRLFGTSEVLGRSIQASTVVGESMRVRIAAILRNPQANSTIGFEALNGLSLSLIPPALSAEALTGDLGWWGNLLIRIRPGASLAAITAGLQRAVDQSPQVQQVPPELRVRLGHRKIMDIELSALRDAYFDREIFASRFSLATDRGNSAVVAGIGAGAVLILTLAIINAVNLTSIRVIERQREIASRKAQGASRYRLVLQLAAESLLVSTIATLLGWLLAYLALPALGKLMGRDLSNLPSLVMIAATILVGAVVGLVMSVYPAWIASGIDSSRVLAGHPYVEPLRGRCLRQALSVLPIATAVALTSLTLALQRQTRFATELPLGFDPDPLLMLELPLADAANGEKAHQLMGALSAVPAVAGVAVVNDPVGRPMNLWSADVQREGTEIFPLDVKLVSSNFFELYDIRPLAGRLFDPRVDSDDQPVSIVINEIAARALGFDVPSLAIGQTVRIWKIEHDGTYQRSSRRIVGIAPDIQFSSLREAPRAMAYELGLFSTTLAVRAKGSTTSAERAIATLWPRYFPNTVLRVTPARAIYAANYLEDARLVHLLAASTLVVVVIAALDGYLLAADVLQRRATGISPGKISGMRRRDIGKRIATEIWPVVLLSVVVALPLAMLAIELCLAPYTKQAPGILWSLAEGLLIVLVIVASSAALRAWRPILLQPAIEPRT